MNPSGNWTKIEEQKSKDSTLFYEFQNDLIQKDDDGNDIYHRFKVTLENASGLLNLEEAILTIPLPQ